MGFTYVLEMQGLRKQNSGSLNDIIIGTNWKVTAINELGQSGSFVGATPFRPQDINIDTFTEYTNLGEAEVLGWIQNVVSGSTPTNYWGHIQERINEEIAKSHHSIVDVTMYDLPWGSGSIDPQYSGSVGSV